MATDPTAWLSAHFFFVGGIYTAAADRVVLEVARPLAEECAGSGLVERWFFIRYSQEGPHVRLRFQGRPEALAEKVRPRVEAAALGSAAVKRLAWVPYEPEVGRYGGAEGVRLAERIFHRSSEAAVKLLAGMEPGARPSRLGKGMLAMLVTLHAFTGSAEAAAALAHTYGHNYLRALVPEPQQQERWLEAFEAGFRRQEDRLSAYVEAAWEALEGGGELPSALAVYRRHLEVLRSDFNRLFEAGRLLAGDQPIAGWDDSVRRIVPSYIHMMSNRLGVSIQEESYLSVLIHKTLFVTARPTQLAAAGSNQR